ncbi:hypothetical protein FT643_06110 [Ketobacter sp. MCCC 1A13808]|uniref:hypothetical protein n=1 Tax=Ketobacter sp. MCCC 1A13808 TaxID=2602738 RepID=UPI0012EB8A7F|nr:hypothetical protein [Ketobacter sp. MCCC 1A13808]MVF11716.1 hypothetical protein [Ketobacter sp. MCCC 1A13808]
MTIPTATKVDSDSFYRVFCCCLLALSLCLYATRAAQADELSGEDYEEIYDEGGTQDTYLDNSELQDEANGDEIEPTLDPDQAEMVREAKASCTQWASESGLDEEDKQAFIDDCVYSQTGY